MNTPNRNLKQKKQNQNRKTHTLTDSGRHLKKAIEARQETKGNDRTSNKSNRKLKTLTEISQTRYRIWRKMMDHSRILCHVGCIVFESEYVNRFLSYRKAIPICQIGWSVWQAFQIGAQNFSFSIYSSLSSNRIASGL